MKITTKTGEVFDDSDVVIDTKMFTAKVKDVNNEIFGDAKYICDAANRIRQQIGILHEAKNFGDTDVASMVKHGYDLIDEFMGLANHYRTRLVARHCASHKIVILNEIYASVARRIANQKEKYGVVAML
jgi:hypothetical protein